MGWQSMRFVCNARECVDKYILVDCQNGGYLPFLRTLNSRKREREIITDLPSWGIRDSNKFDQVRAKESDESFI